MRSRLRVERSMLMAHAMVVFKYRCNYDSCEDCEEYGIGRDVQIEVNYIRKGDGSVFGSVWSVWRNYSLREWR